MPGPRRAPPPVSSRRLTGVPRRGVVLTDPAGRCYIAALPEHGGSGVALGGDGGFHPVTPPPVTGGPTGDVIGPAGAGDEMIAVYDGVTGKLIKDGGMTIADILAMIGAGGGGDVVGPASAVDDRIATYDGTTGKVIQDGGYTIADLIAAASVGGFTPTAVIFADGAGDLTEDPTTFAYDATNNELRVPTIVGGTGTTDDLHLKATTGAGTTASRIFLDVGNNGAIPAVEITRDSGGNFGVMGVGTAGNLAVDCPLNVFGTGADIGYLIKARAAGGAPNAYATMETGGSNANAQAGFSFYQRANTVEWRMAVVGNEGNMMRWQAISSAGAVTNTVFFVSPLSKNLLLASAYSKDVTTGKRCLVIEKDTAPTAVAGDTVALYAKEVAGSVELFAMNEANVETQLTPAAGSSGPLYYEPLTDGDLTQPELIFALGDVVMVAVY